MTQSSPLFSVLIANYNNGKYIEECVESVKKQTYQNWEIIIVDDHSTDNSIDIINSIKRNNSKIIFYKNEKNIGCGGTKRKCVELSNGELCGFLDPDDAIHTRAIDKLVAKHLELQATSMVYSQFYECDENLVIKSVAKFSGPIPVKGSQLTSSHGQKISHFCSFKKRLYESTVGINPNLKRAVDQDLYYKLEEVGTSFFLNEPLYFRRNHSANISLGENRLKAQYWHYLVIKDTYFRRSDLDTVENISLGELKRKYLNICLNKIEQKLGSSDFHNLAYFYFQLLKLSYWDREMLIVFRHLRFLKTIAKKVLSN